jgi:hypothetical protein
MFIGDNDGSIWDGFDQKYGAPQNNTQWMQGQRDGAICNDKHTPEFNAGFAVGCHDKQAGLLNRDALLLFRFFLNGTKG